MKGEAVLEPELQAVSCRVLGRYPGTVSPEKCKCPTSPRALVPGTAALVGLGSLSLDCL